MTKANYPFLDTPFLFPEDAQGLGGCEVGNQVLIGGRAFLRCRLSGNVKGTFCFMGNSFFYLIKKLSKHLMDVSSLLHNERRPEVKEFLF